LLLAGLTIAKPRKLFGITKDKFCLGMGHGRGTRPTQLRNLESRFVVLVQPDWLDRRISRKEQRYALLVGITLVNYE
jgi:hypothetical protein